MSIFVPPPPQGDIPSYEKFPRGSESNELEITTAPRFF